MALPSFIWNPYPVNPKPLILKIIEFLSNLGAYSVCLHPIAITGLIASTLPERFLSIGN
jgi:hypothetical protein